MAMLYQGANFLGTWPSLPLPLGSDFCLCWLHRPCISVMGELFLSLRVRCRWCSDPRRLSPLAHLQLAGLSSAHRQLPTRAPESLLFHLPVFPIHLEAAIAAQPEVSKRSSLPIL